MRTVRAVWRIRCEMNEHGMNWYWVHHKGRFTGIWWSHKRFGYMDEALRYIEEKCNPSQSFYDSKGNTL